MKNIFDEQKILEKIGLLTEQINDLLQTEEGQDFFDSLTIYMLNATKITSDKYRERMESISIQAEKQFISTAQQLRYEGIEKGIKRTAIKMISKGYSNKTIMELTDLKEHEVENIREEYINNNK